ncbi:hypothetical protein CDO44_00125, partial [Pigmentiphaga sp. NML080357]
MFSFFKKKAPPPPPDQERVSGPEAANEGRPDEAARVDAGTADVDPGSSQPGVPGLAGGQSAAPPAVVQ